MPALWVTELFEASLSDSRAQNVKTRYFELCPGLDLIRDINYKKKTKYGLGRLDQSFQRRFACLAKVLHFRDYHGEGELLLPPPRFGRWQRCPSPTKM